MADRRVDMGIVEAAQAGDRLAELRAMRGILARAISSERTLARDLASLSRRLMEVGREIEELEAVTAQEGDNGAVAPDEEFDPASV